MATAFEEKKQRHASGESAKSTDSVTNFIPTPPDGGYGWVVVIASFINHVLIDGISFTYGVFYEDLMKVFKASPSKMALVGSLLVGCYLSSGPIAGALTNKYGCRTVSIVGGFIAAASFFLASFSTSINMLLVTYGVMGGIGMGLAYLPSVIIVSVYFERRRAVATGLAVCGAGVGGFVFAPLGRMLLSTYGWSGALMILSALLLNVCVCGALFRPLQPPQPKRKQFREKNLLDRLREKAHAKRTKMQRSDSVISDSIKKKVYEMKLNREKLVREELGEGTPCGSTNNSSYNLVPSSAPPAVYFPVSEDGDSLVGSPRSPTERYPSIQVPEVVVEDAEPDDVNGVSSSVPRSKPIPIGAGGLRQAVLQKNLPSSNGSVPENKNLLKPILKPNVLHSVPSLPSHKVNGFANITSSAIILEQAKHRQKQALLSGVNKEDYSRPLYRQDIFYSGSIAHIPQFRTSQKEVGSYLESTTIVPPRIPDLSRSRLSRMMPFSKVFRDVLHEMTSWAILKEPCFAVCCLGNGLGMLGIYVPFIFIVSRAIEMNVPENQAVFLLSIIGITNTVGRVLAGALADLKGINSLLLHNVAVFLVGVVCILNMFADTYALMCLMAAVFGLLFATWISLTSIILCDLIGVQRLTNAFGLLSLVRGIGSVCGPPLAGWVLTKTNDFDAAFSVGGTILIVTAVMFFLLHLPCLKPAEPEEMVDSIAV